MNLTPLQILPLLTAIFSVSSQAGIWEEREHLERYMKQLDALNQTVLVQASESADPNARISLNYPKLLHDANQIARKIEHHLNKPLEEYRSIDFPIDAHSKTTTEDSYE
ncbi:RAQPRD family integrative conjugative element protein [Vibrio sp. THAF190c]|uniref:RAQPRD family integrative conjugative element protein n=1 Tax=Vibrio sp. THAF190c TaxID=2587865 RepID=UPI001267A0B3|nr:RAQPRD family integrative conjugative element protein [Vibrio sp. THAF190c]QFT13403.1 Plasmid protein of unknown function [Vibrio sp. THAF190c]